MTRIYVRPEVVVVPEGHAHDPLVDPEVPASVDALREFGHQVVLLGADAGIGATLGPTVATRADELDTREPGAWLVTTDVHDHRWAQALGLRTVLVGGTEEQAHRPERCDLTVRDFRTAVLEILAREATPDIASAMSA